MELGQILTSLIVGKFIVRSQLMVAYISQLTSVKRRLSMCVLLRRIEYEDK